MDLFKKFLIIAIFIYFMLNKANSQSKKHLNLKYFH